MNFKGIIEELNIEIGNIIERKNKEIAVIEKKWITFSAPRFKQEKERRDLERKLVLISSLDDKLEEMVDIKKRINKLDEILPKYEPYREVKDQKLEEAKDKAKIEIGEAILTYMEKAQVEIKKEKDNFAVYASNIIEGIEVETSSVALDLKTLRRRFEDLIKMDSALDQLKKYNGHIETQSFCDELKDGLEPEDAEVINDFFKIITKYTIDMRKVKIKKEEEPIQTFEINKDADITNLTNTNLNLKEQDFLNEILQKEMKELIKLHDTVEFTELEEILFNGLVMSYNIYIENEYKKTITEENLEIFSRNDIITELFRKPKKIIYSTKLAEFIGKKVIESYEDKILNADNVLEEDRFESIIDNINTDLKEKYMVNGVLLFIAKNKLADIKLRLYKNDNLFETEKHCDEYRKTVEFISKTISKKLDKLTKTENGKKDLECILLLLEQYLEVISIGDYEQGYNNLMEYLNVVSPVISESIYRAYKAAADMIIEYRKSNKYTPYEMKYVNIEYGEFYNEIDDMIKFYDNEAKEFNNIENAVYLKRG